MFHFLWLHVSFREQVFKLETQEEPWSAMWTHSDVGMQGLDNFKTAAKETGGNWNVILTENAYPSKTKHHCSPNGQWKQNLYQ